MFVLVLVGIPPVGGFFGKFYLFSGALHAGANQGLLWLVALALFGSLISLYYYLVVLKVIFVDEPSRLTTQPLNGSTFDLLQRITVSLPAAAVLFLGVLPGTLVTRIVDALR